MKKKRNNNNNNKENQNKIYSLPYIGKDLHRFAKQISILISNRFNLKVLSTFKTFKVKNYFLLKSRTPKALCSNVIYKFTGSCDMNMTYVIEAFDYNSPGTSEFQKYSRECPKKSHFIM